MVRAALENGWESFPENRGVAPVAQPAGVDGVLGLATGIQVAGDRASASQAIPVIHRPPGQTRPAGDEFASLRFAAADERSAGNL